MGLKGVKVNDVAYQFDHGYLDNNPIPPTAGNAGKALVVAGNGNLKWSAVSGGGSGGDIPVIDSGDDGKVLTADNGEPVWAEAGGTTLPSMSGNGGKFLAVDGNALAWADVPTEVPSTSGNEGRVLMVHNGDAEWMDVVDGLLPDTSGDDLSLMYTGEGLVWDSPVPHKSSSDAGKVVAVASNGEYALKTLSEVQALQG